MKTFRNICAAAVLALPFASLAVMTAEASPRTHGGYRNGGYTQPIGNYVRRGHQAKPRAWYGTRVFRNRSWGRRGH